MAIGERIKFFRTQQGMTQRELGVAIGLYEKNADIRIAQYESGTRTPKEALVKELARVFHISTNALTVPDIDTYIGLMHTLFTLEDLYGLRISDKEGELCITLDKSDFSTWNSMFDMFSKWRKKYEKLENEEITKDAYDAWRYSYPAIEAERTKASLDMMRSERKAKSKDK